MAYFTQAEMDDMDDFSDDSDGFGFSSFFGGAVDSISSFGLEEAAGVLGLYEQYSNIQNSQPEATTETQKKYEQIQQKSVSTPTTTVQPFDKKTLVIGGAAVGVLALVLILKK